MAQDSIWVSASDKINITDLKEMVAHLVVDPSNGRRIIADLIEPGDIVVLVTPIDEAAPKGRLILPQQQTRYSGYGCDRRRYPGPADPGCACILKQTAEARCYRQPGV